MHDAAKMRSALDHHTWALFARRWLAGQGVSKAWWKKPLEGIKARNSTTSVGDVLQCCDTFLNPCNCLHAQSQHLELQFMTAVSCFILWCYWEGLGLMVSATPSQLEAAVSPALRLLFSTGNKFSSFPCFLQATCPKPLTDLTASGWTLSSFPESG